MTTITPTRLSDALRRIETHWSPHIIADVNDHHVKLAKLSGPFIWHHHPEEDEFFLVLAGRLIIEIEDQPAVELDPGDCVVIPRGIRHRPVASEEVHVLLVEPTSTRNTGEVDHSLTRESLPRLD